SSSIHRFSTYLIGTPRCHRLRRRVRTSPIRRGSLIAMGMPFKLVVDQPTFGDDPFDWTPSFFTGYALHLTENSETYIDFQGPPEARLYMEGLEQYCPRLGQFDTHGWYV